MSTALEALFAGRIYESGCAMRRTTLRHTHLADPPLGIAMWRLGGERFRAAAIAWGPLGGPFELAVPGEPRNRDLYFAALAPFAADLCASRAPRGRLQGRPPARSAHRAHPGRRTAARRSEPDDRRGPGPAGTLPRLPVRSRRRHARPCPHRGGKAPAVLRSPRPRPGPVPSPATRPSRRRALGHPAVTLRAGEPRRPGRADRTAGRNACLLCVCRRGGTRADRSRAHRGHRPCDRYPAG